MIRIWAVRGTAALVVVLLAALAVPVAGAASERTCFYYSNSGWGLWATPNVSCRTAKHVYNDATRRIRSASFRKTINVDAYRCKIEHDAGGSGHCSASRHRRIRFDIP